MRLNRDQLYALAAKSSFGEERELAIQEESERPGSGFTFAIKVRDNAPKSQKGNAHSNGWSYYRMNKDGNIKTLKESDL